MIKYLFKIEPLERGTRRTNLFISQPKVKWFQIITKKLGVRVSRANENKKMRVPKFDKSSSNFIKRTDPIRVRDRSPSQTPFRIFSQPNKPGRP